jgi:hypothetical protein
VRGSGRDLAGSKQSSVAGFFERDKKVVFHSRQRIFSIVEVLPASQEIFYSTELLQILVYC